MDSRLVNLCRMVYYVGSIRGTKECLSLGLHLPLHLTKGLIIPQGKAIKEEGYLILGLHPPLHLIKELMIPKQELHFSTPLLWMNLAWAVNIPLTLIHWE